MHTWPTCPPGSLCIAERDRKEEKKEKKKRKGGGVGKGKNGVATISNPLRLSLSFFLQKREGRKGRGGERRKKKKKRGGRERDGGAERSRALLMFSPLVRRQGGE